MGICGGYGVCVPTGRAAGRGSDRTVGRLERHVRASRTGRLCGRHSSATRCSGTRTEGRKLVEFSIQNVSGMEGMTLLFTLTRGVRVVLEDCYKWVLRLVEYEAVIMWRRVRGRL